MEIFPVEGGLQEGLGCAEPLPVLDGGLEVREAEVVGSVDVQDLVAPVLHGVKEGISQRSPEGTKISVGNFLFWQKLD